MTEENTSSQTTIGHFLRESREGKKVSLKIVSQHTRISLSMLESLELDQLDQLPSKAYVRGFVKSYAKTLGLNESKCIDLLESTYHLHFPGAPEKVEIPKEKETTVTIPSGVKIAIGVAAALVVVVALIVDSKFSFTDSLKSNAPTASQSITPVSLTEDTPLQDPTPLEEVSTNEASPAPTIEVAPAAAPVVAATPVATPTVTPTPKKAPADEEEISFRPFGATPLYTFDKSATAEQLNSWLPSNIRSSMVPGKQNVFINALKGDSWLTYREDSGDIKKFVLKEGRSMLLRGDLVLLFLGNIGGVKVFLNNQLLSLESRSGVKSIIFPQEERTRFSLPLFVYPKDGSVWTSEEYQKRTSN